MEHDNSPRAPKHSDQHLSIPESMAAKVEDWLRTEGYPLEFMVANEFRQAGFHVRQSQYVNDTDLAKPREIDVIAQADCRSNDALIRTTTVVECKWSMKKPWVVFAGPGGISHAACVSQSITNKLGDAILWKEAGQHSLHRLQLFETPKLPTFGGRQAFSKGNDQFYESLLSVVTLSKSLVDRYDKNPPPTGELPPSAVVAFPLIVLQGTLLQATFDERTTKVSVEKKNRVRCHWRGSPAWNWHATIDIVTSDHLSTFAKNRRSDIEHLLTVMQAGHAEISECFATGSLDNLTVTRGARGTIGLPPLLAELKRNS